MIRSCRLSNSRLKKVTMVVAIPDYGNNDLDVRDYMPDISDAAWHEITILDWHEEEMELVKRSPDSSG